jgi:hypothetical protein
MKKSDIYIGCINIEKHIFRSHTPPEKVYCAYVHLYDRRSDRHIHLRKFDHLTPDQLTRLRKLQDGLSLSDGN